RAFPWSRARVGGGLMTEQEWLACVSSDAAIRFLGPRIGERKLRLFACACCRRVWRLLDATSKEYVRQGELRAGGVAVPDHFLVRAGAVDFGAIESATARSTARYAASWTLRTMIRSNGLLDILSVTRNVAAARQIEAWKPRRDVKSGERAQAAESAAQ